MFSCAIVVNKLVSNSDCSEYNLDEAPQTFTFGIDQVKRNDDMPEFYLNDSLHL